MPQVERQLLSEADVQRLFARRGVTAEAGRLLPVRFQFQEPEKQTFRLSLSRAPADICDI
jgi:hypothetical protein